MLHPVVDAECPARHRQQSATFCVQSSRKKNIGRLTNLTHNSNHEWRPDDSTHSTDSISKAGVRTKFSEKEGSSTTVRIPLPWGGVERCLDRRAWYSLYLLNGTGHPSIDCLLVFVLSRLDRRSRLDDLGSCHG